MIMLQQIRIGKWLIEVDIDKTQEFYSKDKPICNCLYCENFVEACKNLKTAVSDVFTELGINPAKPAHLSEFPTDEESKRLYLGHYHLVGRVLEGELCTVTNFNAMNTFEIENFTVGFSEVLEFVPEGFPTPILQVSFEAKILWALKENPDD